MTELSLPKGASAAVTARIRTSGGLDVEDGAWLLAADTAPDLVCWVALLGETGIDRRAHGLVVSGPALGMLFEWAEDHGLTVRAQVHSHLRDAFLSETDQRYGLTVEGFVSAVVPFARRASEAPADWGWWVFHRGRWSRRPPATVLEGGAAVVTFDEGGVRDGP